MTLTGDTSLKTRIVTLLDAEALILIEKKDYAAAVDVLSEAVLMENLRGKLYIHRSVAARVDCLRCLLRQGGGVSPARAVRVLLPVRAFAYTCIGRYREALSDTDAAIELGKGNTRLSMLRAKLFAKLGMAEKEDEEMWQIAKLVPHHPEVRALSCPVVSL